MGVMVTTTARDADLASALVQTMHRLQDLHAETSRPLGLTPQQAHLLCVLITGPLGMTELSRILSIERSSLTSMVDRLERRDLVARVANPAAGKDLAHQCHDAVVDRIRELTADLPAGTRTTLTTTLQSILAQ
jgi:DNA-binding MarR family transcriptional regulator